MARQPGLFDVEERLTRLSDIGDQLEAFARVVDFEMFRPELEAALDYSDGAKGGRPPFDPVLMFKILVIQAHNNLSDDRAEFLINDRLSFMRFLGLGLADKAPDAKTIWVFRERLTRAGAIEALFARFDRAIREAGYIPMSGQIVDASLVAAPKQRNTDAEKADIKAGRIPQAWTERPAKLRQKDRDARWTLVFGKARDARGRHAPRRHRDPGVRLQEPRQHRPAARLHPPLGRHRRQPPRRADAAPGPARPHQHGLHRLGRQRLPRRSERGVHGAARLHAARSTAASRRAGRWPPHIRRGNATRSSVRAAVEHVFAHQKGPMALTHPHHRDRPRQGEDRPRQPHLQHQAPGPARAQRGRPESRGRGTPPAGPTPAGGASMFREESASAPRGLPPFGGPVQI